MWQTHMCIYVVYNIHIYYTHILIHVWYMYIHVCCVCLVARSCPTLCKPWTVAHQAPLSMWILQARILEWVAMPSSRGSSQPRDPTCVHTYVIHIQNLYWLCVGSALSALCASTSVILSISQMWPLRSQSQEVARPMLNPRGSGFIFAFLTSWWRWYSRYHLTVWLTWFVGCWCL